LIVFTTQAKFNDLVAKHSNLQATEGTLDSKRQRAELQLQAAQTKISDLESSNDELKRLNVDMKRQVEKWQHLETKGGEATEKEHQKRVALEFELQGVKETHENELIEDANSLEKLKNRYEKAREKAAAYEVGVPPLCGNGSSQHWILGRSKTTRER